LLFCAGKSYFWFVFVQGVDYLKVDGCGDASQLVSLWHFAKQQHHCQYRYAGGYARMGAALQASGRDIVYSCKRAPPIFIPLFTHHATACLPVLVPYVLTSPSNEQNLNYVPIPFSSPSQPGSWPAYVGDDETKKPFATYIQGAACFPLPRPSPPNSRSWSRWLQPVAQLGRHPVQLAEPRMPLLSRMQNTITGIIILSGAHRRPLW
jgi:hypothetical protein